MAGSTSPRLTIPLYGKAVAMFLGSRIVCGEEDPHWTEEKTEAQKGEETSKPSRHGFEPGLLGIVFYAKHLMARASVSPLVNWTL